MEKKKAIKLIKQILIVFYLLVFAGLLGLHVWVKLPGAGVSFESLIYWWILIGWIFAIVNFKWGSSASLIPAFFLFVVGAALVTLGFKGIAEIIMKVSFIGWLVGITQALIEYRKMSK